MPGLVKIGLTRFDTRGRLKQLYNATGVPVMFEELKSIRVRNQKLAERVLHNMLRDVRYNVMREFFTIPPIDAVSIVIEILSLPLFKPE